MCLRFRVTDEHEVAYPFVACAASELRTAMARAAQASAEYTAGRSGAARHGPRVLRLQVKVEPGDNPRAWAAHSSGSPYPAADPDMSDDLVRGKPRR